MSLKPNLFIVGAPKAGTTSLFEYLKDIPDVFLPSLKELNYFSKDDLKNSYYKDYKVNSFEKYESFFKTKVRHQHLIDGSVSYFISSKAPQRIHAFNPDSKIIICIRNPIKRAFSHYLMDKRMGYAKKPFEYYLKDQNSYQHKQYIENSKYFKYLNRYTEIFGGENVIVVVLEEFEKSIKHLEKRLMLKTPSESEKVVKVRKINENKTPRNLIARIAQNNRLLASELKLIIPKPIVETIKPILYRNAKDEKLNPDDFKLLLKLLQDEIFELSVYLKRDLFKMWEIDINDKRKQKS